MAAKDESAGRMHGLVVLLTTVESMTYGSLVEVRPTVQTGTGLATRESGLFCVLALSESTGEDGKRITW